MCGLRDIRGYDGVDPERLVKVILAAAAQGSPGHSFGTTLEMVPNVEKRDGHIVLSPILDMFGVRYVIFRGRPSSGTSVVSQSLDYFVVENPSALPRVFVPQRVEVATNDAERLQKLTSPSFNPREVAYVEAPVDLPVSCRGEVKIMDEIPTRLTLSANMETPGLVVLADLWDKGWSAWVNQKRVPILRANHAVRGVVLPAGVSTVEFRYQPASFAWGLRLAGFAIVVLLLWTAVNRPSRSASQPKLEEPVIPAGNETQVPGPAQASPV
jgi:hypothetical protein